MRRGDGELHLHVTPPTPIGERARGMAGCWPWRGSPAATPPGQGRSQGPCARWRALIIAAEPCDLTRSPPALRHLAAVRQRSATFLGLSGCVHATQRPPRSLQKLPQSDHSLRHNVNDTEITQRGGLFSEVRWRKRTVAEVPVLSTHIKRHPSAEPLETHPATPNLSLCARTRAAGTTSSATSSAQKTKKTRSMHRNNFVIQRIGQMPFSGDRHTHRQTGIVGYRK